MRSTEISNTNNYKSFITDKEAKDKEKEKNAALAVPRLSVCADAQKVDRAKLAQTEVLTTYFRFIVQIKRCSTFLQINMLVKCSIGSKQQKYRTFIPIRIRIVTVLVCNISIT